MEAPAGNVNIKTEAEAEAYTEATASEEGDMSPPAMVDPSSEEERPSAHALGKAPGRVAVPTPPAAPPRMTPPDAVVPLMVPPTQRPLSFTYPAWSSWLVHERGEHPRYAEMKECERKHHAFKRALQDTGMPQDARPSTISSSSSRSRR